MAHNAYDQNTAKRRLRELKHSPYPPTTRVLSAIGSRVKGLLTGGRTPGIAMTPSSIANKYNGSPTLLP